MILGLLLACAHRAPVQVDKGLEPAVTTLAALQQARDPRRVAVVVGVDDYGDPTFPALHHAGDDAEAVAAALRSDEVGGFDEVRLLTGADADRAGVLEALRGVRDTTRSGDVLVVYFSGHGTRARDAEGTWHRYLLPRDARSGALPTTALDLADLQAFFGSLAPSRKALIVDACFDGDGRSVVDPEAGPGPDDALAPPAGRIGEGEAHLFATSAGRPAREDDTLGHGVYTWFLLDAMTWSFGEADRDGDGVLTAWEAHDWARGRAIDRTGGAQVPEATFRVVGQADVVLSGQQGARRRADRALVYLYPTEHHPLAGAALVVDGREKGLLPGTLPIAPGRHHVVVRDSEGGTRVDGTLRLAGGHAYSVDEVARLAQGPTSSLGLRTVAVGSAPFRDAIGPGALGTELVLTDRRDGPVGHGLVGALSAGGAGSAAHPGLDQGRFVGWATASAGWQGDRGIFRGRVGLGPSFVWLPPAGDALGWWFFAAGPDATGGIVLGRGWTATASGRLHVAALDPDADAHLDVVPWTSLSVGLEVDR
ncbi:MAG: caspase family protein [Alphaproteobacteria bacterium]|nr:caspase family protein [Alphaproteobacteria bacterium]MCB9698534.1 caspase family protein [Alphaproteobacteria bacterium]